MNAILYYAHASSAMTGSLFDAFEYFISAYEHNPEIKLLFLKGTENAIDRMISVMKNRYDLSDLHGYRDNITSVSFKDLMMSEFDNLLVLDYTTIHKTKGLIRAKNLIVISEKHTDDPEYFYSKELYNVTYYGEMPFHYKDVNYRMKFLLDRFKPLRNVRNALYVNSPKGNVKTPILKELNPTDKPIIFKSRTHENNLFEQFDSYLYYHANRWFDPHPRLFIECFHYGKDIRYVNNHGLKDGSWYRYNDIQEVGILGRNLSKSDEIVRQLI